jgi:hypothetical protein
MRPPIASHRLDRDGRLLEARMIVRRLGSAVAIVVVLGACSSMQRQYDVHRSNLSCDEANRYAFRSMQSLGYSVDTFRLASVGSPGVIKGSKDAGKGSGASDATVKIDCRADGVQLSASEDQLLKQDMTFSRGFFLAFTSLADNRVASAAWADQQSGGTTGGGVKIDIRPQLGLESKLDFGEDLAAGNVLAVKVTVANGSDRTYKLDPAAFELRPMEGSGKILQVAIPDAARSLAKAAAADAGAPPPDAARLEGLLRERALTGRTLAPGDRVEGFLYFPAGRYARARATLVDVETDEGEGFLVEF